ncbi:hypothetical protein H6F75_27020 [Nodosilinea sp. FACHB-131]|uniref:DUF6876 family protein n=1 Tax=Cyanophyceae TaxID=3028117 RepID=UPI001682E4EE|nr:DUF6876 family protein [Nodosilinea sp. FACHB-131]MBD1877139.1 hypothetical protein [Nodosilinea sp. FACHB-131]
MENGTATTTIKESDLRGFTGTEQYHPLPFSPHYFLTDGVAFLVKEGGGLWLIAHIVACQLHPLIAGNPDLQHMQFWRVSLDDDASGLVQWLRDANEPILSHRVSCAGFTLKKVTLYLQRGVVMLPSEY